jgi:sugar O-acyltransferase (sialic acid O-acetyltransferase NeuD family)
VSAGHRTAAYVAGTRSFAAEVIDFARDAGIEVQGLLEPFERERVSTTIHEQPVTWLDDGPPTRGPRAVLLGTGETDRRRTVARLQSAGWEIVSLLHPQAHVAPSAGLGMGVIIGPGAVAGARSRIGDYAVLGRGALVGHHTEIGDFATLGPGSNVAGNVKLGQDAFVGMGALVRDHLTVGPAAVIAMGAVVISDVGDGVQVRGAPAVAVVD